MQHRGISANLLKEAIRYADKNKRMISLETHNEKNVSFYRHFGFELYEIVETLYDLKQFCMIRESKNV
jgi:GNAT superfamily N-acetyltransferase